MTISFDTITTKEEGETFYVTGSTTGIADGTKLYFKFIGDNITEDDIYNNWGLTNESEVFGDGRFQTSSRLANDQNTEGTETLVVEVYSDTSRTNKIASTSFNVTDTSIDLENGGWESNFSLDFDTITTKEEGETFYVTGSTTGIADGTKLYFKFIGDNITEDDIYNNWGLTNESEVFGDGRFQTSSRLANDQNTEGTETLVVEVYSDTSRTNKIASTSFNVTDTSIDLENGGWESNFSSDFDTNLKIRGNSFYLIVEGPTWTEAEVNGNKFGGNLVTINDEDENQWLVDNFPHETSWYTYWIGLNDENEEGVYQWSSGEEFSYSNWRPTSGPNRISTDKSSIGPSYIEFQVNDLNESKAGQWNDHPPDHLNNPVGIAEIPFVRENDSAYIIVEGPTWEEAEANAVILGGHLVTINDEDENQWLVDNFPHETSWYTYWIGLNDENEEGVYQWSSGEEFSYSNWRPTSGPNRISTDKSSIGPSYIEFQVNDLNESKAGQWNDHPPDHLNNPVGIAEIKLAPNNLPTGELLINGNLNVGETLTIDVSNISDIDNYEGYTPIYNYSWEISDDFGVSWSALTTEDGTDNDDSYILTSNEVGKKLRGSISFVDGYGSTESITSSASEEIIPSLKIRGNSFYSIVYGPSWLEAEGNANKFGGNLVTINDSDENNWIIETFKDKFIEEINNNRLYIGLNDAENEGEYKWISGELSDFRSYYPGSNEPGAELPEIDYHEFALTDSYNRSGWNDIPNNHLEVFGTWNAISGLAEIPFIRRNDSAYVIVEGPTWEEAEANAVTLGGHLVSINDSEENEWIKSEFSKENYYYSGDSNPGDPDTWLHFWIGATDKNIEGQWEWISGEEWSFNDEIESENLTANYQDPERDYIAVIFNVPTMGNYYWSNGEDKYDPNNDNNFRGIAEIKLAPNNLPTGELLINGNLNIGETLTIDFSNISDLDNYEGYIPTYNYSWEISDDFGVSWNALTTEDGTDNDNSYTLTSNEAGKKLRGSISYVDGYGSTESITSAASEEVAPVLLIREGKFYKVVEGPTWDEAEANAVALGGHLVTINSEEENDWLISNINWLPPDDTTKGAYLTNLIAYWIGLNDSNTEGKLTWSDGSALDYIKNGSSDTYGDEDWFSLVNNGDWNDLTQTPGDWSMGNWQMKYGIAEIPLSYFSISDLTLEEGDRGFITINRLGNILTTQNLNLISADGTAIDGLDYNLINESISFRSGETSKKIFFRTIEDSEYESTETFSLIITASKADEIPAQISDGEALITIDDDDDDMQGVITADFYVEDISIVEGETGTLTITRSGNTSTSQNIFVTSSDNSALGGVDYKSINQNVSFSPGELFKTVSIETLEDNIEEFNETFFVSLEASPEDIVPARIINEQATITIRDNDQEVTSNEELFKISTQINIPREGYICTTTVSTQNVAEGTTLYWSLSGENIDISDFALGSLTGSGNVGSDGNFSFMHNIANDGIIEGYETINIKLFSDEERTNQIAATRPLTIQDSAITEQIADIITDLQGISKVVTNLVQGENYTLKHIRDFDGNSHANSSTEGVDSAYKYQNTIDINGDGIEEAIYTNLKSGRWVTASIDPSTGKIDYSDYGEGGTTRVVGIYDDPLIAEGNKYGGYLSDGITPAPAQFGATGSDRYIDLNGDGDTDDENEDRLALNSQVRFQRDLEKDNLIAKVSSDYDGDGVFEVYWKLADNSAYLRALMHEDGNIRYSNYQSPEQMNEYLTAQGHESVIADIV